jgi:hypothetical protein
VDIYANLQRLTDMRPVVVDPNIPLETLLTDLQRAPTDEDRSFVRDENRCADGSVRPDGRHAAARFPGALARRAAA